MLVGRELREFIRVPELHDVGRTFVARRRSTPRLILRFGQDSGCGLIAHQHLWLDTADAGVSGKLLDEIAEQIATSAAAGKNLIHRLKWNLFLQLLFLASVADASNLRATDNCQ